MRKLLSLFTLAAFALLAADTASAQVTAPTLTISTAGTTVTASWTQVAGATYIVQVGTFSGGANVFNSNVGSVLSGTGVLGNNASYWARVFAVVSGVTSSASNEVQFNLGSPPPGIPESFQAAVNGSTLTFTWTPPTSGGAPTSYVVKAGTVFGGTNLTPGFNLGSGTTANVNIAGLLGQGTYFARLVAVNAGGNSPESAEAVFVIGNLPGVPTPNRPVVNGNSVTLSWNAPQSGLAVTGYTLEGQGNDFRVLNPIGAYINMPPTTTSLTVPVVPNGNYYWRIRANSNGVNGGVYGTAAFFVGPGPQASGPGPRAQDPLPGRSLPKPGYLGSVINQIGSTYRGDLLNSCRDTGGNNLWVFKLVRELRRFDSRWGLNWKRGNRGDMSQDVIDYNNGVLPDESTIDVYLTDTISGHCGPNPQPDNNDVTAITFSSGTIGMWTLQPYIAAGFQP